MAAGTSILETPPWIIACVFAVLVVITLSFNFLLEGLHHWLHHKGRHGLVAALHHMNTELALLGLATVILLGCQDRIAATCVSSETYTLTKVWMSFVNDRACCLAETYGVSNCFLKERGVYDLKGFAQCCRNPIGGDLNLANATCSANSITKYKKPDKLSIYGYPADCAGRVEISYKECQNAPNLRPVVSVNALHQIHLYIFILAAAHVTVGIIIILVASFRVRGWRSWDNDEGGEAYQDTVNRELSNSAYPSVAANGVGAPGHGKDHDVEAKRPPPNGNGKLPASIDLPEGTVGRKWRFWRGRPRPRNWCGELFWCIARQFSFQFLSKEEFYFMRASFCLTHGIRTARDKTDPHAVPYSVFTAYFISMLEYDFADMCGLSVDIWCFLTAILLISTSLGYTIWVFTIFAGLLLFILNTKLVWILRLTARGGRINTLKPKAFWFSYSKMLKWLLRFLLFMVSFVFASAIFMASQFGIDSCYFNTTGFQRASIVPWWVPLLISFIYLITMCSLTLPLYSLVNHCGAKDEKDKQRLDDFIAEYRHGGGGHGHGGGHGGH